MAHAPEQDDLAAFLAEVADARPLKASNRITHAPAAAAPIPRQSLRAEQEALADTLSDAPPADLDLETGEALSYRRNGIAADVLRRLRRGQWTIQDHLDLHGLVVPEARALLASFLALAVRRGLRCVRVVHGKGYRSASGEPVLKGKVAGWLAQRDEVLAYVQARDQDGGGGAVLVLLRTARGVAGNQ
jgi:DNA-nicking Smr family endonuclease